MSDEELEQSSWLDEQSLYVLFFFFKRLIRHPMYALTLVLLFRVSFLERSSAQEMPDDDINERDITNDLKSKLLSDNELLVNDVQFESTFAGNQSQLSECATLSHPGSYLSFVQWQNSTHTRGTEIIDDPVHDNRWVVGEIGYPQPLFMSQGINSNLFVSKWSPSGNLYWAKELAGVSKAHGHSADVTHDNSIIVTGYSKQFKSQVGTCYQTLVAKMHDSQLQWARAFESFNQSLSKNKDFAHYNSLALMDNRVIQLTYKYGKKAKDAVVIQLQQDGTLTRSWQFKHITSADGALDLAHNQDHATLVAHQSLANQFDIVPLYSTPYKPQSYKLQLPFNKVHYKSSTLTKSGHLLMMGDNHNHLAYDFKHTNTWLVDLDQHLNLNRACFFNTRFTLEGQALTQSSDQTVWLTGYIRRNIANNIFLAQLDNHNKLSQLQAFATDTHSEGKQLTVPFEFEWQI